jgi:hypothetical protein
LVTFPFEYARPEENVVVAFQVGTPFASTSTWPFTPVLVVPSALEPLPYRIAPLVIVGQPVPPLETGSAVPRARLEK